MMSGTRFNSSHGHVNDVFLKASPDSNASSRSSVPVLPLNDCQRVSSQQVAECREMLLNKIPLSQLKTLINCSRGNPLPAALPSKKPIQRVKRKYKKDKPESGTTSKNIEVTPATVQQVQYDFPIARITIGKLKVTSPLFPVNRSSFVKIDRENSKLDYWVQQRIHEWHVSVYSVQLSEVRSIIMNNCVISIVVFRPATVTASYKEAGAYSPDVAISEVSSSLMHEIIMTSSSDATSFVWSLACLYPPILTRLSYGAAHLHHPSQLEQQHQASTSVNSLDNYCVRPDSLNDVRWAGTFRPMTGNGNLNGFPSMYMQHDYQQLETPCPVPQAFQSTSAIYSNSYEMIFYNQAELSQSIVAETPTVEMANARNLSEVSDKQMHFTGENTSKAYTDIYESHYAMTVPVAATLSEYAMNYINSAQGELFGVEDMEKEIENNKHGFSGCFKEDANALPNIPLCGGDSKNGQSGSGFQYDAAGWGAGVEHLTK